MFVTQYINVELCPGARDLVVADGHHEDIGEEWEGVDDSVGVVTWQTEEDIPRQGSEEIIQGVKKCLLYKDKVQVKSWWNFHLWD